MSGLTLVRQSVDGVTLLRDMSDVPGGVTLAFTERSGGVSEGCYASLNLGDACGDDPDRVAENRRRVVAAIGCAGLEGRLVNPRQVHGDHVVMVDSAEPEPLARAIAEARAGADAIVCTACDVPVLLCYADCVPVILAAPGGFAVIHSGWRGTIARISAKAASVLMERTGCSAADVRAYVGPHIAGEDYEVSEDLLARFAAEFGDAVVAGPRHLALEPAVRLALEQVGVTPDHICSAGVSTPRACDRFYSYRASGGSCGRHGAIACMKAPDGAGTSESR